MADDIDNPDAEVPFTDEEIEKLREHREEALEFLREEEINQIFSPECGHCGELSAGTITIETGEHQKGYKICEACARKILVWF